MRRPPDRENLSERDVESSNATLNAVFGGARQKSWMNSSSGPVRPTPRSSMSKAAGLSSMLSQRTGPDVLPSPAPSDEASPVLSPAVVENMRMDQHRHHTPREEPQQIAESVHLSVNGREKETAPLPQRGRALRIQEAYGLSPNGSIDSAQPPDSETGEINSMESPPRSNLSIQTSLGEQDFQHQLLLLSPDMRDFQPNLQSSTLPPTDMAQHGFDGSPYNTFQPQSGRNRSASNVLSNTTYNGAPSNFPLPSTLLRNQVASTPHRGSSIQAHTNRRQRIQAPTMPSLAPRIALIDTYIEFVGGAQNLNDSLEKPRFNLLREACKSEDSFYVALHQIFCVWNYDQNEVTSIQSLPDAGTLALAFRILGQLIKDNDKLSSNHLKWFAQFPSPLGHLLSRSEPYRLIVSHVGVFLRNLADNWNNMSRGCILRGYPPLVDELVNKMSLLSPVLQGVVFTASRRNLGVIDGSIGKQVEDLFKQDQKGHQELAGRYNTARPPTQKEIEERNRRLSEKYLELFSQQLQRRLSISSNTTVSPPLQVSAPTLHGNGTPQSPALISPSSPQSIWHQGGTGTNPAIQQRLPRPNQNERLAQSNSPYPTILSVGSRPPGVAGLRTYSENIISPTFAQDLSTQSPVQQNNHFQQAPRNPNFHVLPSQEQHECVTPGQNASSNQISQLSAMQQHQHQLQQRLLAQQQSQPFAQQPEWLQQQAHSQMLHPARQQVLQQTQQQNMHRQQQVIAMNRAVLTRDGNNVVQSQPQIRSRTNSISATGQRTPSGHPHIAGHSAQNFALQAYIQRGPLDRPLIPPQGFVEPSQPINLEFTALHQAHVRSLNLVPADDVVDNALGNHPNRFYQAVKSFALAPVKISTLSVLYKVQFDVSEEEYEQVAKDVCSETDRLQVRQYKPGTTQYRLRCVRKRRDASECTMSDWVVSDTAWPETIFLEVNNRVIEIRRKAHHGKDLPVDLTRLVLPSKALPNGSNRITVSVPKMWKEKRDISYFLAVEVTEILHHPDLISTITQEQRIPKEQTVNNIKASLTPPALIDDDDIAMVSSDLSIDLADPFTARIFDIPVRGSTCLHRECFDLETFLLTRNSKAKQPHQPSMVDVWKCPLCGRDARPLELRVDEFLCEVREVLEKQGNLEIKAILISADGSWRPKPEVLSRKRKAKSYPGDSDDESGGEAEGVECVKTKSTAEAEQGAGGKRVVEVIDLDDD